MIEWFTLHTAFWRLKLENGIQADPYYHYSVAIRLYNEKFIKTFFCQNIIENKKVNNVQQSV